KSSVVIAGRLVFALTFATFVFAFTFALRLPSRLAFARFEFVFEPDPMPAMAMIITTAPMPMSATRATPPRSHQIAFDFLTGPGTERCDCCCWPNWEPWVATGVETW